MLHLIVLDPKSKLLSLFGIILEFTFPPKTTLSVTALPKFTSPFKLDVSSTVKEPLIFPL